MNLRNLLWFCSSHFFKSRNLNWNCMSIDNNTIHQLLWIFLIDFCVYNGKQYQQGQSWYDGCSYKCTCEDAEKGVYRCLSRSVSQTHRILGFWLLDCKKKILSLKFIIHINKHFAWVWKRESYLFSFSLYTTEGMMFLMG